MRLFLALVSSLAIGGDFLAVSQSVPDLGALIQDLGSDEVEVRDRAQSSLKAMKFQAVPELKRQLRSTLGAEVKSRLTEVIRDLTLVESSRLYHLFKVREALIVRAEALGAENPSEYVAGECARARRYLDDIFDDQSAVARSQYSYSTIAKRLQRFGPWIMPALIDRLGGEPRWIVRSRGILLEYPADEAVPPLIEALGSANEAIVVEASRILAGLRSNEAAEPLLKIYHDKNISGAVRTAVREALITITKKDPD